MRPVTVHTTISAPRERVFDAIADFSGRVAWCDHYMREYRLARANPRGRGAAARFRIEPPGGVQWVELQIVEVDPPRRVAESGRYGRIGRSRIVAEWRLEQAGSGTRVELEIWTDPAPADALKEALGARRWVRRQAKTSLERLRMVFEEPPAEPLARVTVAGWEPAKHARFGT